MSHGIPVSLTAFLRGAPEAAKSAPPRQASEAGKVRIITDARTNSLLLTGSAANLEQLAGVIAELDVGVDPASRPAPSPASLDEVLATLENLRVEVERLSKRVSALEAKQNPAGEK